jgi:hypothetical protein
MAALGGSDAGAWQRSGGAHRRRAALDIRGWAGVRTSGCRELAAVCRAQARARRAGARGRGGAAAAAMQHKGRAQVERPGRRRRFLVARKQEVLEQESGREGTGAQAARALRWRRRCRNVSRKMRGKKMRG